MLSLTIGRVYWYIIVSILGMGFLIYGRKRPDGPAIVAGLVLMIYPYFISSLGWNIAVGVLICAVYLFLKLVMRI